MNNTNLRNFLDIPYDKLEEMNLTAKAEAETAPQKMEKKYIRLDVKH